LDSNGPGNTELARRLDRVLEQRGLADAGVAVHHEDGAVTVARGIQQPLEHRSLALPAEQPLGRLADRHGSSMPLGSRTKEFRDAIPHPLQRQCLIH
jgi:hypothetical protein